MKFSELYILFEVGGVIPSQIGLCYENDYIFITICSWETAISRLLMGYQI